MPQPKRTLSEDSVVSGLAPDPAAVPDVQVHIGLPGKSVRKGYWRLYLTLELNEYLEIPDADIVHFENLDSDQTPLRGTAVWVKRSAEVAHTRTGPPQMQAEFLAGDLSQAFLPSAQMGPVAASTWTLTLVTTTLLCMFTATVTICTTTNCATKSGTSATSCCLCTRA
jgi:hypothetical protein